MGVDARFNPEYLITAAGQLSLAFEQASLGAPDLLNELSAIANPMGGWEVSALDLARWEAVALEHDGETIKVRMVMYGEGRRVRRDTTGRRIAGSQLRALPTVMTLAVQLTRDPVHPWMICEAITVTGPLADEYEIIADDAARRTRFVLATPLVALGVLVTLAIPAVFAALVTMLPVLLVAASVTGSQVTLGAAFGWLIAVYIVGPTAVLSLLRLRAADPRTGRTVPVTVGADGISLNGTRYARGEVTALRVRPSLCDLRGMVTRRPFFPVVVELTTTRGTRRHTVWTDHRHWIDERVTSEIEARLAVPVDGPSNWSKLARAVIGR